MTIDDCKKGLDPSKFGDLRKDVCDVLSDPHLPAAVSDTVVEQKTLGSMLLLLSPLLFLWTVRWKTSVRAARAIQNELQRKNSENQQVKREENARG
jgi:non-homologous end joining protein Ku